MDSNNFILRGKEYGIEKSNLVRYEQKLEALSSSVVIWPPPIQVDLSGRKDALIRNLDQISLEMRTLRPQTTTLVRGGPIPEHTVLKRTHSDGQNHVILPQSSHRSWEYMELGPPTAVWISQEYVPLLRTIGEWRVIVVNSMIHYVVHTLPVVVDSQQTWSSKLVREFYSLEEWR